MQQNIDVAWIKSELCRDLRRTSSLVIPCAENVRAALIKAVQRLINDQATNKVFFRVLRLRLWAELIKSHGARLSAQRGQCGKPNKGSDVCKRWLLDTAGDQLGPVVHQSVLKDVRS